MGADGFVDLLDSDILKLEKVSRVLQERQGSYTNLEGFRKEAIDRFAKAGFKVDVKVYDTVEQGTYAFEIEVLERYAGEVDPDQQVHEVVTDILGLGHSGVIKSGGEGLIKP